MFNSLMFMFIVHSNHVFQIGKNAAYGFEHALKVSDDLGRTAKRRKVVDFSKISAQNLFQVVCEIIGRELPVTPFPNKADFSGITSVGDFQVN